MIKHYYTFDDFVDDWRQWKTNDIITENIIECLRHSIFEMCVNGYEKIDIFNAIKQFVTNGTSWVDICSIFSELSKSKYVNPIVKKKAIW